MLKRGAKLNVRLRSLSVAYGWLGLLVLSSIAGQVFYHPPAADPPGKSIAESPVVRSFVSAVSLIQRSYIKPPEWDVLTRLAIDRMLHSLDPHSNFYDLNQFTEMQNEQNSHYFGIGATIDRRNNSLYVVGVMPGMPADRAGLRYGDEIVEVEGKAVETWPQKKVMANVRGERGTLVDITIERAGLLGRKDLVIERSEVPYLSVRSSFMIRPGTGYIDLTGGFSQETTNELREAIRKLKSQGMEQLLIDLRQNPGGLLKQAIEVSELFLPAGRVIVSVVGREGRSLQRSYVSENQTPELFPLALLIDEGTASAAEILAGALQENGRALIVGEESFGKGLVQTVFRLRDGTGLSLTTARYLTPNGRSIHRSFAAGRIYDYGLSRYLKSPAIEQMPVSGGVRPDLPVRPAGLTTSSDEYLRLRDACFEFVRLASTGLVPGLEDWRVRRVEADPRPRGGEYPINNFVRRLFREFLQAHPEWLLSDRLTGPAQRYADRRIRTEMISAAYGAEAAEQYLLDGDLQVLRALDWLKQRPLP